MLYLYFDIMIFAAIHLKVSALMLHLYKIHMLAEIVNNNMWCSLNYFKNKKSVV